MIGVVVAAAVEHAKRQPVSGFLPVSVSRVLREEKPCRHHLILFGEATRQKHDPETHHYQPKQRLTLHLDLRFANPLHSPRQIAKMDQELAQEVLAAVVAAVAVAAVAAAAAVVVVVAAAAG